MLTNPIKYGYALNPSDWEYSSIHRFIKHGILPEGWGCNDDLCWACQRQPT